MMRDAYVIKTPKKLIEVALPLDAINDEASQRKRKAPGGYPTSIHKWWAQRPVAATRAVIFAQLVNDPSWKWEFDHPGEEYPAHVKASWAKSRKRLFGIIEELVKWENTTDERVLSKARAEIWKSWRETCDVNADHPQASELFDPVRLPAFHDPFAGGASIPVEAQRLGLDVTASDLNPVAVMINKAMVEIPPKFAGMPPVNPKIHAQKALMDREWRRAEGLADDVRYYGELLRKAAEERIGHLHPGFEVTRLAASEDRRLTPLIGKKLKIVAWIWARTVKSPNPAFRDVDVPLVSTFVLSNKPGREAYVEPVIRRENYRFVIRMGKATDSSVKQGTKLGRGASFRCLLSDVAISSDYIREEAQQGRMRSRLMAVVVESELGRIYVAPSEDQERIAAEASPDWKPEVLMPENPRWFSPPLYGLKAYGDLFTRRQLVVLNTLVELTATLRAQIRQDAADAKLSGDNKSLDDGGTGTEAYADAICVYLTFVVSRVLHYGSAVCTWLPKDAAIARTFTKQAVQMTWDYAEGNVFGKSSTEWSQCCKVIAQAIEFLPAGTPATVLQADAASSDPPVRRSMVSTDPPYYDNVGYADLSDFFYVWLRRSLRSIYPALFATVSVPKAEELVATPYRHGGKEAAEAFFLDGMTRAMHRIAEHAHPAVPVSIYYAFKQSETSNEAGTSSTGWETFLEAVNRAGLAVTGTWPLRTEGDNRQVGLGTNALASSVLLVCRPRAADAPTTGRRAFVAELGRVLPRALEDMISGAENAGAPVSPVDLSQAMIGPGMAIFSRYSAVLEADGSPMSVQTALKLINRFLADDDFDADTQFCVSWFEQNGWKSGSFGSADNLARAKGTSVEGVKSAGVIHSAGGSVRLTRPSEYPDESNFETDDRTPVWEVLHHLIRALRTNGEQGAAAILGGAQSRAEAARRLAYRLYTLCERSGWAEDARTYNDLIASWAAIEAVTTQVSGIVQRSFFE